MKIYGDQSEYPPDTISFYLYKLNHIENTLFEIGFVKPVNIPDWIAEKLHIVNWSYEKIKGETSKAVLIPIPKRNKTKR